MELTLLISPEKPSILKIKLVVSPAFKSVDDPQMSDLIEKPSSIGTGEILSSIIPIISSFRTPLAFTFSQNNCLIKLSASIREKVHFLEFFIDSKIFCTFSAKAIFSITARIFSSSSRIRT